MLVIMYFVIDHIGGILKSYIVLQYIRRPFAIMYCTVNDKSMVGHLVNQQSNEFGRRKLGKFHN